jgi:hypothetical protein
MSGPFASKAQDYASRGFSPLPILRKELDPRGKGKRPGYSGFSDFAVPMSKWQGYCEAVMTPTEIGRISRMDPDAGLGLACGFNGLVAVDVDDPRVFTITRELFGPAHAPIKVGRKGGTAFFHGVGIPARKFREKLNADLKRPTLVEILSVGSQTVCPPTIHPDTGKPYRWVSGSLCEIGHPLELPPFRSEWLADLENALAPFMEPKRETAAFEAQRREIAQLSDIERRRYQGFAQLALESEAAALGKLSKPGRNSALFRATCLLGKWAHHGILSGEVIAAKFMDACQRNELAKDNGPRDVMKTIQAGFNFAQNDSLPVLSDRTHNFEGEHHAWH